MLSQRLKSGTILGLSLLAAVFFLPDHVMVLLFLAVCALGQVEFYAFLDARGIPHFKVVGTLSGLAVAGGAWAACHWRFPGWQQAEPVLLAAASSAIFIRQIVHTRTNRPWETMAGTLIGVVYVGFFFGFILKILTVWGDAAGRMLLLYLVAVVKCTDMGAYFVGCAIGKHKMLPRISPAKSWEGTVGGVLTGVAASVGMAAATGTTLSAFGLTPWRAVALGLLLAVSGVIGDLVESVFKRASGVKDSGTYIQGMGGILDVLDSLLFSAPLMYLFCLWAGGPP